MFEITTDQDGTVQLSGRFDASQVEAAEQVLERFTDSLTIDFRNLNYISSAGLGVLLATYKRLDNLGKTMVLRNLNPHIADVFRLTGLDRVFDIR
ncbi:MAG: STAS domain-containing protein [Candidatus Zixiibacteriota bacterium]|nr:MAG: STAS domain-containing protein [candidate division Zixibacteria bacterium]